MPSIQRSFAAVLTGVIAVSAATWAVTTAKPEHTDGSLKTALIIAALLGQWLVSGGAAGFLAGRAGWLHGLFVAAAGCPISSALWLGLLWGWRTFSRAHYWPICLVFLVFAAPLALLGGIIGRFMGGPDVDEPPRRLTIRPS